jgi:hypothetical protein
VVRGTFSPVRAWRPAVVARLARTLGGIVVTMVTIDTTRYSAVVAAFVERYPDAVAHLDKRPQTGLVSQWGTNASLLGAIDFSLRQGSTELLAFHDGPRNMWASPAALRLLEELAANRVLRFQVAASRPPSLLARLFGRRNAT